VSLIFTDQGIQNSIQFLRAASFRIKENISNFSYYNQTSISGENLQAALKAVNVAQAALEAEMKIIRDSDQYKTEYNESYLTSISGDLFSEAAKTK
jgi:hypothetical protein